MRLSTDSIIASSSARARRDFENVNACGLTVVGRMENGRKLIKIDFSDGTRNGRRIKCLHARGISAGPVYRRRVRHAKRRRENARRPLDKACYAHRNDEKKKCVYKSMLASRFRIPRVGISSSNNQNDHNAVLRWQK